MKTVEKMIEELKKFPKDAMCYGYTGEVRGLGVRLKEQYGFIFCGDTVVDEGNIPSEYFRDNPTEEEGTR